MTPKQLEAAARELCRLRGLDPDQSNLNWGTFGSDAAFELEALQMRLDCLAVGKAVRELVSLEEHNARVQRGRDAARAPRGNGIACPQCGAELVDGQTGFSNGYSGSWSVHCTGCGWSGSKAT